MATNEELTKMTKSRDWYRSRLNTTSVEILTYWSKLPDGVNKDKFADAFEITGPKVIERD